MDQSILAEAFQQARLKVYRADRHISEAEHTFTHYIQTDGCRVVDDTDPETGEQLIRVVSGQLPAHLVLAIGDAFHCLSSAMDYVMTGLMRAKTGNASRVSFPTDETRQALRKSFMKPRKHNAKKPPNRRVLEAFPAIALELLTMIQPYKGGNYGLWEVRKADNLDKHNLLIPVFNLTRITIPTLYDEKNHSWMENMTFEVAPGGIVRFVRYQTGNGGRLKLYGQISPTASITFPDTSEVFPGCPVFPTITKSRHYVGEAIDRIENIALR